MKRKQSVKAYLTDEEPNHCAGWAIGMFCDKEPFLAFHIEGHDVNLELAELQKRMPWLLKHVPIGMVKP